MLNNKILPVQIGAVRHPFSMEVSKYLQPINGLSGDPGVSYNMTQSHPGSGLFLDGTQTVFLVAQELTPADAVKPQPQVVTVDAIDPAGQSRTGQVLLFVQENRQCYLSLSCAECTALQVISSQFITWS